MVSNLPIWVFAEEKLAYERERLPDGRVPILAFTLTDPPPAQAARAAPRLYGPREGTGDYWTGAARAMRPVPAPGSGAYWASVGRAGIFGGQAVAQRFAADVRMVSMPVGLEVTGFNFTQEEALAAYFDARDAASLVMTREVVLRPQETAGKLDSFRRVAAFVSGVALADLRVSLITPLSAGSFKVISGAGMEHDADDRLNFGRDAPGAPVAYAERRPAYIDFAALRAAGQAPGMTKYERALVPPRIVAAICLPVFADFGPWGEPDPARRPPPLGVVSIDSSVTLTQLFNDTKALAQVVAASIALAPLLAP
jgi:hypothetical protein